MVACKPTSRTEVVVSNFPGITYVVELVLYLYVIKESMPRCSAYGE